MARHRSLASLAAVFMVLLVVYASLYPFEGWRWPAGMPWQQAFGLPWPPWRDHVDEWLNRAGYLPVGLLMTAAFLRSGHHPLLCLMAGAALPSLLSYAMEVSQILLPSRVPSLRDWAGNTIGGVAGAVLAVVLQLTGLFDRWRELRDRRFSSDSAMALILLMLWPAALLAPSPVPFALGQCWDEIRSWMVPLLTRLPLSALGLEIDLGARPAAQPGLTPLGEATAILLGMGSALLLAASAALPGVRRIGVLAAVAVLGVMGMAFSTAMNFGPGHAWAWLTPAAILALLALLPTLAALTLPSARLCAVLGLLVTAASIMVGAQAPTDAYHAAHLQAWEQGRFIRFSGLAQWVAWLWPYIAITWWVQHLLREPEFIQFKR